MLLFISCGSTGDDIMEEYTQDNTQNSLALYFLGDSIIDYWNDVDDYFPSYKCYNYGVTRTGINTFLSKVNLATLKGTTCIIEIGTNDMKQVISENRFDEYVRDYINVLSSLEAKKIYLLSLLPRNRAIDNFDYNSHYPSMNEKINNEVSIHLDNVTYINIYDKFLKDGVINKAYTYDGLHPNALGYKLIADVLNSYLKDYK